MFFYIYEKFKNLYLKFLLNYAHIYHVANVSGFCVPYA